jgi:hypothetical protein
MGLLNSLVPVKGALETNWQSNKWLWRTTEAGTGAGVEGDLVPSIRR